MNRSEVEMFRKKKSSVNGGEVKELKSVIKELREVSTSLKETSTKLQIYVEIMKEENQASPA